MDLFRQLKIVGDFQLLNIRFHLPPSGGGPSAIRWIQLYKTPVGSPTHLSTEDIYCQQTAEVLVVGDTIHFKDITNGSYFCDNHLFTNLLPNF